VLSDLRTQHENALSARTAELDERRQLDLEAAQQKADQRLVAREQELEGELKAALAKQADEHAAILAGEKKRNQEDLTEREAQYSARKRELDGQIGKLSVDLEQTREKLENAETSVEALTTTKASLESQLADTTANLQNQLAETKASLEAQIAATKKQLETAEAQGRDLDNSLAIRTAERDELAGERDALKADLAARNGELATTRERLDDAEEKGRALTAALEAKKAEAEQTRGQLDSTNQVLSVERARLEKARAKWGEDRASLDRARQALQSAIEKLSEPESRPLED
jgi:chromosome segregation ATPase